MIVPGRDVPFGVFARSLWHRTLDHNVVDYAGSVAFSFVLALFPFLVFAVALTGLVIDPRVLDSLLEPLRRVLLPEAADVVMEHLREITARSQMGLLTFSALGAVWVASGAIAALTTAFNASYEVKETRPYWKARGLAVLTTLVATVLFIFGSMIAFATPVIADRLGGLFGTAILWLRWPAAALIIMSLLAILYRVLPDVQQRFCFLTLGSIVAVVVWTLTSLGFSYYVTHFASYHAVYGTLGGAVVLLLWMWISSFAVLLGAEINAVLEHLSHEGKERGARTMAEQARPGEAKEAPARGAALETNSIFRAWRKSS